jgi:hypothetical protein
MHAEKFSVEAFRTRFHSFLNRVGVTIAQPDEMQSTVVSPLQDYGWTVAEDVA